MQRRAERTAHGRPEPALIDGVFDEERARERQRDAADPDEEASAEALLESGHIDGRLRHRCQPLLARNLAAHCYRFLVDDRRRDIGGRRRLQDRC
jgi:hypothetical protein